MSDRVYVIAEAGVNHNGSLELAQELVDAAAASGADAVKFQTFDARVLASAHAPKAAYQIETTGNGKSQLQMLTELELPREWHAPLQARAHDRGIEFLSTAFDAGSLAFLHDLGVPMFKIPSGELTNGPLLWRFARTGKPLVLSTGMATLSEVEQALAVIAHAVNADTEPADLDEVWKSWASQAARTSLQGRVTLLHCTSQYPTPHAEVNLRAMDTLAAAFGLPVGYSDHTEGCLIPAAAVARGAVLIEKHFTLDRELPGPDHRASLEPGELKRMVADIRALSLALGDGCKAPQASEWDTRRAARQQVVATRDIAAGAAFQRADLTTSRSGQGRPAMALWSTVGQHAARAYRAGETIDP
ncbi:MAG TPA: N-acetylneuraminate synthase [Burkholderiaceae bacterium]|nr:N-acetylneuraminate synthase [Burkholderiaceae bacterium]